MLKITVFTVLLVNTAEVGSLMNKPEVFNSDNTEPRLDNSSSDFKTKLPGEWVSGETLQSHLMGGFSFLMQ